MTAQEILANEFYQALFKGTYAWHQLEIEAEELQDE